MNHNIFDKIVKKFSRQGHRIKVITYKNYYEKLKLHNKVYTDRLEAYKKIKEILCSEETRSRLFMHYFDTGSTHVLRDYFKDSIPYDTYNRAILEEAVKDKDATWKYMKELFMEDLLHSIDEKETYFTMDLAYLMGMCRDNARDEEHEIYITYEEIDIV